MNAITPSASIRLDPSTRPTASQPPTDRPPSGQIFTAMASIMKKVGAVGKNRKTNQSAGNYAYRGIEDLYAAVQLVMAEHGVFSLPEVLEQRREERGTRNGGMLIYTILTVRHTFYAADGSSVAAVCVGEAMDPSDKSTNKAMSASEKYSLIQAFKIPTREMKDSEEDTPEPSAKKAPAPALAPAGPAAAPSKAPSAASAPARTEQRASAPAAIAASSAATPTAAAPAKRNPVPMAHRPQHAGMRRWRVELSEAFIHRKMDGQSRDLACKEFLDSCGVTWLDELGPEQRHTLLMQVRNGAADRFKTDKRAAAAAAAQ